ncbi:MAG: hypothetical protein HN909_02065 [Phycisphaerales bacterium]|jgi:hypothetical protein|nr:hypothetical protein [Phycisphaerales bacterium]MBT7170535.1 hypothetical protein [Phycisphaerales bacterium]
MPRRILLMVLVGLMASGCHYSKSTRDSAKRETAKLLFEVYHRTRVANTPFTPPGGHNLMPVLSADPTPPPTGIPKTPIVRAAVLAYLKDVLLSGPDMAKRETAAELLAREFPDQIAVIRPQCDAATQALLDAAKKKWVKE